MKKLFLFYFIFIWVLQLNAQTSEEDFLHQQDSIQSSDLIKI